MRDDDDDENERTSQTWAEKIRYFHRRNCVLIYSLVTIACGSIVGIAIKTYFHLSTVQKAQVKFPGELFVSLLRTMSVCLITASIIAGVCSLGRAVSRRVALQTLVFILATSAVSVTEGIILAEVIQPGWAVNITSKTDQPRILFTASDAIMDFIRNLVPRNFMGAAVRQYTTYRYLVPRSPTSNSSFRSKEFRAKVMGIDLPQPNFFGLILGSFIIGASVAKIGKCGKTLADAVVTSYEALQILCGYLRAILPFGLFFLSIDAIQNIESWDFYVSHRKFLFTVCLGHVFHLLVVLPIIYWLLTSCSFYGVMSRSYSPLLASMLLSSSSATLPITSLCCEERLKINKSLTRVMLPIVTTMNKNGTIIYEVIAGIYIAQLSQITLSIPNWLVIGLAAAYSSMATSTGPVLASKISIFVCSVSGLPMTHIPWLVLLESFIDRFNTVVNLTGDIMCVALLHKIATRDLRDLEVETMETINLEALDPDFIVAVR